MSTRAQIIVKDKFDKLWFYRHSDGYPEGAMPMLETFLDYVKRKIIRDNVEQASGWLILFGAKEYGEKKKDITSPTEEGYSGWKCGSIEPSVPALHGDIEYLYIIDLEYKTLSVFNEDFKSHI